MIASEPATAPLRRRRLRCAARAVAAALSLTVIAASAPGPPPAGAVPLSTLARSDVSAFRPTALDVQPISDRSASLSPELADISIKSAQYDAVAATYREAEAKLAAATKARVDAENTIAQMHISEQQLTAAIADSTVQKKAVTAQMASVRASLRALAVSTYVQGTESEFARTFDIREGIEYGHQQALVGAVNERRLGEAAVLEQRHDELVLGINNAYGERHRIRTGIDTIVAARDAAAADEVRLRGELAGQLANLERARALAVVVGTDFPLVALDAYFRAARGMAARRPACGVPWWALAGITRVESRHGYFGGAQLLPDGDTTVPIIGIPLDGTRNTRRITDTDGGRLDGDVAFDRAVGPMQFIPTTWARWARDGNGDGVANPHNIYDASATAAAYLCASGALTDDTGLRRAFFSYNRSDDYVAKVLGWSHLYESRVGLAA